MAYPFKTHFPREKGTSAFTCAHLALAIRDCRLASRKDRLTPEEPSSEDSREGPSEDSSEDSSESSGPPAPVRLYPAAVPPRAGPREGGDKRRELCGGDPAHLADPGRWDAVARLQWEPRCDHVITPAELGRRIAAIREDGDFERLQTICQELAAALVAAFPRLGAEPLSTVLHLVALGNDFALAAAQEPTLLTYAKNELQLQVDLAVSLRLPL